MGIQTKLTLGAALLLPALLAPTAEGASTDRWSDVQFMPTADDGLAVIGASFDGRQVTGPISMPYFTLDGERFELSNDLRVSGPTLTPGQGELTATATYRVPTPRGDVELTLSYAFSDADAQWDDLGKMGSSVTYTGPEGDYAFAWRLDIDAEGAGNDRFQIYGEERQGRRQFHTPAKETSLEIAGADAWFGRIQAKVMDGHSYDTMTSVYLDSVDSDATLFALANGHGENEANPRALLSGQRLQDVNADAAGTPGLGSDLVLWYEARNSGASGSVGPQFLIAAPTARQGFMEIDAMRFTQFPPANAPIGGGTATLPSAWATGGFNLTDVINDSTIGFDYKSDYGEIQGFLNDGKDYSSDEGPNNWYVHIAIVRQLSGPLGPAILGVMHDITGYDTNGVFREGATVFYGPLTKNYSCDAVAPNDCQSALLWTTAHEAGHAFNLHHEDWEMPSDPASDFYENSVIMGYSYDIGTLHWDFGPDSGDVHLQSHPDEYVRPGYGVDFIATIPVPYPYNTVDGHEDGHDPI